MNTCYNCGNRFVSSLISDMYCSQECIDEDDLRLKQGNDIVDMAMRENPDAFSDINRLRLDAQGLNASSTLNLAKLGVAISKKEQD